MNALLILLISIVCLFFGYILYGRWLAKIWGLDDKNITPAHAFNDGNDYCPAKAPVLLGHHFSSIAGEMCIRDRYSPPSFTIIF